MFLNIYAYDTISDICSSEDTTNFSLINIKHIVSIDEIWTKKCDAEDSMLINKITLSNGRIMYTNDKDAEHKLETVLLANNLLLPDGISYELP